MNDSWPQPIRFDPDDRRTWPKDYRPVLAWKVAGAAIDDWIIAWFHDSKWDSDEGWETEAETGDPWLPLPPPPNA